MKNFSNGGTTEEAKRHFESESTTFWVTGNLTSSLQALSLTLTLILTSSKPSPPSSAPSSPPNSYPFSSPASTSPSSASFTPTPPTALLEEELFPSTPCFLRALFLITLTASYLGFQGFVDSDKCYLSASFMHRCTSRCKLGFTTPCKIPTPTSRALSQASSCFSRSVNR